MEISGELERPGSANVSRQNVHKVSKTGRFSPMDFATALVTVVRPTSLSRRRRGGRNSSAVSRFNRRFDFSEEMRSGFMPERIAYDETAHPPARIQVPVSML